MKSAREVERGAEEARAVVRPRVRRSESLIQELRSDWHHAAGLSARFARLPRAFRVGLIVSTFALALSIVIASHMLYGKPARRLSRIPPDAAAPTPSVQPSTPAPAP